MTNYQTGHDAEKVVAEHLADRGFKIIELNWKTKWCEIDIVARKDRAIYFVEVKSRRGDSFGSGLDYITKPKLQKMKFAAELWVTNKNWDGDYQLVAAEVDGAKITFIDDLFV
ncbi:MAG TPA: YraN family protein [Patescibacteria group bacterium]|nr:YraN family protein [Patescibacteria group bacterium]